MLKTKTNNLKKMPKTNIIFITIIILLIVSNIYFLYNYLTIEKEDDTIEEILFTPTKEDYQEEKKYYAPIKFSKFKKIYKSDKVTTIAVIDNSSNTYNKFIEMINKTAYYKNTKIYLLELSKLSKKNEIAFYELDEGLINLETNYLITVSNNKILSITTFENENINKIIEGLGE